MPSQPSLQSCTHLHTSLTRLIHSWINRLTQRACYKKASAYGSRVGWSLAHQQQTCCTVLSKALFADFSPCRLLVQSDLISSYSCCIATQPESPLATSSTMTRSSLTAGSFGTAWVTCGNRRPDIVAYHTK